MKGASQGRPTLAPTYRWPPCRSFIFIIAHWPVPFKKSVWGLLLASSFSAIFAILLPVAVGVNVTVKVQVPPPARVFGLMGQLFV